MKDSSVHTLPRLYVDAPLAPGIPVPVGAETSHYLKNVLRQQPGDCVRLFNGREGEWQAEIVQADKKGGILSPTHCLRPQPVPAPARSHLIFPLLKKTRMEWVLEKAVEIGVHELHPVITERSEIRDLNAERLAAQIREASEQCERLTLPVLHPLVPLSRLVADWPSELPILAAIERHSASLLREALSAVSSCGLLAGPEGGFSDSEKERLLRHPAVHPVCLGETILRAETALLLMLAGTRL